MKSTIIHLDNQELKFIMLLVNLILVTACNDKSVDSDSLEVSKTFIHDYYVDDDLNNAIKLTTQKASTTLQKELSIIDSVDTPEPVTGKPEISVELVDNQSLSNTESTLVWKINSSQANTLFVKTLLVYSDSEKIWKVADFIESDREF